MTKQFSTLIFSAIALSIITGCGGTDTDPSVPVSVINGITDNYTVTRGANLSLDGSSSTDDVKIINYTWMIDDKIVSNKASDKLLVRVPVGEHKVCLTTEDADKKSNMVCKNIKVIEQKIKTPTAIINNIPSSGWKTKCKITIDGKESTANFERTIQSYRWLKDGAEIGTDINQTFEFDTEGEHNITLEVTDNMGDKDTITKSVQIAQIGNPTVKLTILNPYQQKIFSDESNTSITWNTSDTDNFIPSEGNHVFFSVAGSYDDCNLTDDNLTYIWDGRIYKSGNGTLRNHCFAQKPFLRKIHRDFNTTGHIYPSFGTVLLDDPSDFTNMDPIPTRVSKNIYNATKYIYPYDTSLGDGVLAQSKEINTPYVYIELCNGKILDYDRLEIKLIIKDNLHDKEIVITKTIKINPAG